MWPGYPGSFPPKSTFHRTAISRSLQNGHQWLLENGLVLKKSTHLVSLIEMFPPTVYNYRKHQECYLSNNITIYITIEIVKTFSRSREFEITVQNWAKDLSICFKHQRLRIQQTYTNLMNEGFVIFPDKWWYERLMSPTKAKNHSPFKKTTYTDGWLISSPDNNLKFCNKESI